MKACLLLLASLASASLAQKMGCPNGPPLTCHGPDMIQCSGSRDPKTGEQLTPDFCIPRTIGPGPGACMNHCPKDCPEHSVACQRVDPYGCKGPYTCEHGST